DVVDLAVLPVEAQEKRGDAVGAGLPADADDDAVRGLLGLDLHDAVTRAGQVRGVEALRHDAVKPDRLEALEPVECLVPIRRGRGEREALRLALEVWTPLRERHAPDLLAFPNEDIEGDERCGDLGRELA